MKNSPIGSSKSKTSVVSSSKEPSPSVKPSTLNVSPAQRQRLIYSGRPSEDQVKRRSSLPLTTNIQNKQATSIPNAKVDSATIAESQPRLKNGLFPTPTLNHVSKTKAECNQKLQKRNCRLCCKRNCDSFGFVVHPIEDLEELRGLCVGWDVFHWHLLAFIILLENDFSSIDFLFCKLECVY